MVDDMVMDELIGWMSICVEVINVVFVCVAMFGSKRGSMECVW
jgi:hypothetical protein